jgi:hypothetical protein
MFSQGSYYWLEYLGTLITVEGKRTYTVTPGGVSNYCPNSRNFSTATLHNVTLTPNESVSWDDSFNVTRATATGSNPSITVTSLGPISSSRVTASVWLQGDATNYPGTASAQYEVTLTLSDTLGVQVYTKTVTVDTTLNRFAISGYFDNSDTAVKLKISWTNTSGEIGLDACQIEINDWASEYIHNASSSAPAARTMFAAPDRILGVGKYMPGTTPTELDVYKYDPNLYPNERAVRPILISEPRYSNQGGVLNLENVSADTHVIYRAKQVPVKLTGATGETVVIPEPWYWLLVKGARAFQLQAMWDVGSNGGSPMALKDFYTAVELAVQFSDPGPNWSYICNSHPRMMR